jgi:fatty-acyl-CoA synthase
LHTEPFPQTIDSALAIQATLRPDRLAFAHDQERITFGELDTVAGSLASALHDHGIRRGDRVAIVLPSGLAFVRFFYAIQRLGAVPCAVNPFAPAETVVRRVMRIRPAAAIVLEAMPGPRCLVADSLPPSAQAIGAPNPGPDDIAFLQLTSGTSGEPRAAMVLQRNVAAMQQVTIDVLEITSDDILVSWVPPWHDLGLVRFILTPAFAGTACHIVTPSIRSIPRWLEVTAAERGTITGAPDFAWRLAARLGDPQLDLSSLRFATNGGEPVRRSTIDAFESRFRLRNVIRPGYGLAEATLGVTFTRPHAEVHVDERGNVSCGTPVAGVEVRIAEDGEILVRGPIVFGGYFDADDATRASLRDGWLYTGDTGYLDDEGRLHVLGRKRSMLKRGGAILAPRELEEAAQSAGGVRVAAAVGLPPTEARSTESIVVLIEPERAGDAEALGVAVARRIRQVLGFAPERVIVVKPRAIPMTPNGKIRHDVLGVQLAEGTFPPESVLFNAASDREFAD